MKKKNLLIVIVLVILVLCGALFVHMIGISKSPTGDLVVENWPGQDNAFMICDDHVVALYCRNDEVEALVIPDTFWGRPVTEVNTYYCSMYEEPTVIVLGKNIEVIGEGAFCAYKGLKLIRGGENVRIIGEGAFDDCMCLERVEFGANVERIEREAFSSCKVLSGINTSDKLSYVGELAFEDSGIEEIYLPDTASVASDAFEGTIWEQMQD